MKMVSACLAGYPCRYDGRAKPDDAVIDAVSRGEMLPVCPEALGGLPCPREPAQISGGNGADVMRGTARVLTRDGRDVTKEFLRGAHAAVELCRRYGINEAILTDKSPSCGCGQVYDGSFSGRLITGKGVCAQALAEAGIDVRASSTGALAGKRIDAKAHGMVE